jgi:NTP pyrophosphatase (non-canonical NTP hydrolase)
MKTINYSLLEKEIFKFSGERDWDQFHSIKNLSMALSVESSELVEIFQWMTDTESNSIAGDEMKFPKVKDEVADIFIYLIRISSKLNINLEEAVLSKMEKNIEKYPVEYFKGSSRKYNE